MPAPKMPPTQYDIIQLRGGLDLVTPTLSLPSGVARDAVNYEVSITGGYSRIAGYERFDGRPNPSDATYTLLTVNDARIPANKQVVVLLLHYEGVILYTGSERSYEACVSL